MRKRKQNLLLNNIPLDAPLEVLGPRSQPSQQHHRGQQCWSGSWDLGASGRCSAHATTAWWRSSASSSRWSSSAAPSTSANSERRRSTSTRSATTSLLPAPTAYLKKPNPNHPPNPIPIPTITSLDTTNPTSSS